MRGFGTAEIEPYTVRLWEVARADRRSCLRSLALCIHFGRLHSCARTPLTSAMPLANQLMQIAAPLDDPFATGGAHGAGGRHCRCGAENFSRRATILKQAIAIFEPDLERYFADAKTRR